MFFSRLQSTRLVARTRDEPRAVDRAPRDAGQRSIVGAAGVMKLKRFLLRYYPPGIILEYEKDGEVPPRAIRAESHSCALVHAPALTRPAPSPLVQMLQKDIPLLTLAPNTDVDALVSQIIRTEPLISENRRPQLLKLVYKLCALPTSARSLHRLHRLLCLHAAAPTR